MSVLEDSRPFAQQLSNVYFTILSLFCFKLFVKISLAILSHFYIVKGNRKEAARIAAEFYGVTQGQDNNCPFPGDTQVRLALRPHRLIPHLETSRSRGSC
uniref:Ankyrin repeat and SOCS box containing 5 n=1 Tax=Molossus molossus TaxID=27622 RepID=A0A7J8GJ94_MOLMO|nr:ankyrin repeat and SOCS box containing 5 [Molossus molossus]